MKIFKDKEGNKLTFKEFIEKWKIGISGITPLQRIDSQLAGTKIMLLGLFLGLIMSLIGYQKLWWVAIILTGGIINTFMQYVTLIQQQRAFKTLEDNSVDLTDVKDKLDKLFDSDDEEELKKEKSFGKMRDVEVLKKMGNIILDSGNKTCCATEMKGGKKK